MFQRWAGAIVGLMLGIGSSSAQFHAATESFIAANGRDTLLCDVYLPEDPAPKGWGIVFLHGGGFSGGQRDDTVNRTYCTKMAKRGVAVASIDYRLRQIGEGFHCNVPTEAKREAIRWAAEDLSAVIKVLKHRFPGGIIACGSSAGAEAVLDAAFNLELPELRGVISLAGAIEPRAEWADVPVLAFHGTCDALVPFCTAVHHYCPDDSPGALVLAGGGALAQLHQPVSLVAYENAGHELATTLLSNPFFIERNIQFLQAIAQGTFEPEHLTIPLYRPCALPQSSPVPCN